MPDPAGGMFGIAWKIAKEVGKEPKQTPGDKIIEKTYGDYDTYDWSGQQTSKGSEVRRKGSDC